LPARISYTESVADGQNYSLKLKMTKALLSFPRNLSPTPIGERESIVWIPACAGMTPLCRFEIWICFIV